MKHRISGMDEVLRIDAGLAKGVCTYNGFLHKQNSGKNLRCRFADPHTLLQIHCVQRERMSGSISISRKLFRWKMLSAL